MDEILLKSVTELLERADNGARITMRECEDFLNTIPGFTDKHSLEDTRRFLEYLGDPSQNIKIIHVAGTNGKGSVCSYISSVLVSADYSVGMFTSPHLVNINERFAVDGKPVSEGVFVEVFVETLRRVMEYDGESYFPTYFEFLFFVAMILYDVYPVDYLILETGLGGRLDATNAVAEPLLTVITEIGFDHMQYLGTTIGEIAGEKAGIIKPHVPVVFFDKRKEASDVIAGRAHELDSRVVVVESKDIENAECAADEGGNKYVAFSYNSLYYRYADLRLSTTAVYQAENASVAIAALEVLRDLGARVTEEDIRNGLLTARWDGRMEEMRPGVYVDGAHNMDGITAFLDSVSGIQSEGRKLLLFGIVDDKQYGEIVKKVLESRQFDAIYVAVLETRRSVSISDLKSVFEDARDELGIIGLTVKYYSNVRDAMTDIITIRKSGDLVFAAGSLYLVGQIKSVI